MRVKRAIRIKIHVRCPVEPGSLIADSYLYRVGSDLKFEFDEATDIFPGVKSTIDLYLLEEPELHLFECGPSEFRERLRRYPEIGTRWHNE